MCRANGTLRRNPFPRSEEHTFELQSQSNLVCRLLLENKNRNPAPSESSASPPCLSPRGRDLSQPPTRPSPTPSRCPGSRPPDGHSSPLSTGAPVCPDGTE